MCICVCVCTHCPSEMKRSFCSLISQTTNTSSGGLGRGGNPTDCRKLQKHYLKNLNDKNHRCLMSFKKCISILYFLNERCSSLKSPKNKKTKTYVLFPLVAFIHADSFGLICPGFETSIITPVQVKTTIPSPVPKDTGLNFSVLFHLH